MECSRYTRWCGSPRLAPARPPTPLGWSRHALLVMLLLALIGDENVVVASRLLLQQSAVSPPSTSTTAVPLQTIVSANTSTWDQLVNATRSAVVTTPAALTLNDMLSGQSAPSVTAASGPVEDSTGDQTTVEQQQQSLALLSKLLSLTHTTSSPSPVQQVSATATAFTPTVVGSGGIKVVTSNPISVSNPIKSFDPVVSKKTFGILPVVVPVPGLSDILGALGTLLKG